MSVTRYELNLVLRTDSPLHSGGAEYTVDRSRPSDDAEVPERQTETRAFARDGAGRPVLSGRSVKGALRATWTEAYGRDKDHKAVRALWGDQDRAAALTVHAIDLTDARTADRTGIAVDRYWGTAGDTALFEHEIIPSGEDLHLRLTGQVGSVGSVDDEADRAAFERLLGQLVGLLRAGRVSLGGRQNAGWGRVSLQEPATGVHVRRDVLDGPAGLLAFLEDSDRDVVVDVVDPPGPRVVTVTIDWSSPTGILVARPRNTHERGNDETIPTKPLRERSRRDTDPEDPGAMVLPGSSVRGALRTRASRIARTVLGVEGRLPEEVEDWSCTGVHDQLAQDPWLVRELFGSTERRGAVSVRETTASKERGSFLRMHNAIDRWTGGVVDGGLYSETVVDASWNALVLEVDLRRIAGDAGVAAGSVRAQAGAAGEAAPRREVALNRRRAALCLLGLVVAELATGTLPLGSRGTRGMGAVEVRGVTVNGPADLIGAPWRLGASAPGLEGGRQIAHDLLAQLRTLNEAIASDGGGEWADYLDETTTHREAQ
ncbi:RAMP superfamily CRISPR-associated protein [Actinomyces oricola]